MTPKQPSDRPRDPRRDEPGAPRPERISVPQLGRVVAGKVQAPPPAVPPPVHRARTGGTVVGLAPPAPQSAPMPLKRPVPSLHDLGTLEPPRSLPPPPGSAAPRSMSPAPWDPLRSSKQLKDAVESQGDRLVRAPESTPLPAAAPRIRWYETAEGVVNVVTGASKALGALIGGTLVALGTYRATAPAPPAPPPVEFSCPHWADWTPEDDAKRGPLCQRIHRLELDANADEGAIKAIRTTLGDVQREAAEIGRRVPAVKSDPNRPPN